MSFRAFVEIGHSGAGIPDVFAKYGGPHFAAAFAAIEGHCFVNKGFFAHDGWLLDQAHRLRGIPGTIIHGRYDVVAAIDTAFLLAKARVRPIQKP